MENVESRPVITTNKPKSFPRRVLDVLKELTGPEPRDSSGNPLYTPPRSTIENSGKPWSDLVKNP